MAGLLDFFGAGPQTGGLLEMDDPRTQMMLGLAGGLMQPGSQPRRQTFGEALGVGMNQGMQQYNLASQLQQRRKALEEEMRLRGEETQMKREDRLSAQQERQLAQQKQAAIMEYLQAQDPSGRLLAAYMIDPKAVSDRILPPQLKLAPINPTEVTPESLRKAQEAGDPSALVPRPKMEVGPNGVVYDKNAIQPGQTFNDPNKPFGIGPGGAVVPNAPFQAFDVARQRAGAANVMQVNEGQRGFTNTRDLRTEYSGLPETKAYKEMQTTADIIRSALKTPSPANDLAAATKFMKMLDPGSVVRESELAMAMSATGLLDRVTSYHNMLLKGEKLTPAQRKDFYDSTGRILAAAEEQQRKVAGRYRAEAGKWGLDPDSVVPEIKPLSPAAGRTVKRTGLYQGRKVVEYSDGSVDYAD